MIKPMTVQSGELKDLLVNVRQKAQGARDWSESAEREALKDSKVGFGKFPLVNRFWIRNDGQESIPIHMLVFRTCSL